jgi:hypothetical protein
MRTVSTDPTIDPSEWTTLDEAAKILRREIDSVGASQRSLLRLLRQRPNVVCAVAATLPAGASNGLLAGLIPLPDQCQWVSIHKIDWFTSQVRAFPLLAGTHWESRCPPDHMLGVRVRRTEVVGIVEEERTATERALAHRREVTARLFDEVFWPVPRVLAWVAFRHEEGVGASLGDASWRVVQAAWQLRDPNRHETLLRALQDGSLTAVKDGNVLARESWAGANGRDWPVVHFRREDVLALWPKLAKAKRPNIGPSTTAMESDLPSQRPSFDPTTLAPIRNRPGNGGVKMDAAVAAIRCAVEQGALSVLELRKMREKNLVTLFPDAKRTLLAEARRRALWQMAEDQARRQNSDEIATNDK